VSNRRRLPRRADPRRRAREAEEAVRALTAAALGGDEELLGRIAGEACQDAELAGAVILAAAFALAEASRRLAAA
jgi:hypothetical protein